jgi:hypothetical protein
MRLLLSVIGISLLLLSCKSAQSAPSIEQTALVKAAIEQQQFRIVSDWAYPQASTGLQQLSNIGLIQPGSNAGAISLIGNSNFLEVSRDSITSHLPYFGERQMQIAYNGSDSAIKFDGPLEDYSISKNKKSVYTVTFRARSNSESFKVAIMLYPNASARMQLTGTGRFPISYAGVLQDLNSE